MSKGTASQGLKGKFKLTQPCRRCGRSAYHKKKGICSSCGYGRSSKMRQYSWQKKNWNRKRTKKSR